MTLMWLQVSTTKNKNSSEVFDLFLVIVMRRRKRLREKERERERERERLALRLNESACKTYYSCFVTSAPSINKSNVGSWLETLQGEYCKKDLVGLVGWRLLISRWVNADGQHKVGLKGMKVGTLLLYGHGTKKESAADGSNEIFKMI